jgi:hypothetical protein
MMDYLENYFQEKPHYINKYKRKDNSDSYQWNTLCPRHLNTIQGKNEVKTFKEK